MALVHGLEKFLFKRASQGKQLPEVVEERSFRSQKQEEHDQLPVKR